MRRFVLAAVFALATSNVQAQDLIAKLPLSQMNLPWPYYTYIVDVEGDNVPEALVVSTHSNLVTLIGIRGATGAKPPHYLGNGFCAEQFQFDRDVNLPGISPGIYPQRIGNRDVLVVAYWQSDAEVRSLTKVACR